MCSRGHAWDCVNIRSKHTEVMIYEWFSCDFTPWTGVSVVGRGWLYGCRASVFCFQVPRGRRHFTSALHRKPVPF